MVKLTPDLVMQSIQHINAVKDRELVLRGFKIPVVENLGVTMDQFDSIDFTDNDIRRLDGFPLLKRIKNLLLSNNKIVRITDTLSESLPKLESAYLMHNNIGDLHDLDVFASFPKLQYLSLIGNPVTKKEHYRSYLINKIPQLRVLDFQRIRAIERQAASKLFRSKKGKELVKAVEKGRRAIANTFVAGEGLLQNKAKTGLSEEEQKSIREAINKASTMDEVERLHKMLKAGTVPGQNGANGTNGDAEEMEE